MENIFYKILEMDDMATWVIIGMLLVRLLLKKLPKNYTMVLWCLVLFRILVPISIESNMSIIPVSTMVNIEEREIERNMQLPTEKTIEIAKIPIKTNLVTNIYYAVLCIMLGYGVYSTVKLKNSLKKAKLHKDNIYVCENISTGFVLGVLKPKIYIPVGLNKEEERYMISHEQCHIKRFDHINKLIWYFTVCIYWCNPLIWLCFDLVSKDMEMACDERVVKAIGGKKQYSTVILNFATNNRSERLSPVAFSGGEIKERIKNILSYKKPKLIVGGLALLGILCVSISLVSEPLKQTIDIEEPSKVEMVNKQNSDKLEAKYKDYIELPDFEYKGNDVIKKLVHETEKIINLNEKIYKGEFIVDTVEIFGSYREEDKLKVFANIDKERYIMDKDKILHLEGGSVMPVAITYKIEGDKYTVETYRLPESGEGYGESVKKMATMPVSNKNISGLANRMLNKRTTQFYNRNKLNLKELLKEKNLKDVKLEFITEDLKIAYRKLS